jgi:tetratricopeptide (TPR) repeat protein
MGQGRWGDARVRLDGAQMLLVDKSDADEILKYYREIAAEGTRQKDRADELYNKGQYLEALKAYHRISAEFSPLPPGRAARDALKLAESDPAAQSALQEANASGMNLLVDKIIETRFRAIARAATQPSSQPSSSPASAALAKAPTSAPATTPALPPEGVSRALKVKYLPLDEQARVVELLEQIARLYGMSPTGMRARADLDALSADAPLQAALTQWRAGEQVRKDFAKAEAFRQGGLPAKALEFYREILQKYPDTPEAAKARSHVATLELQLANQPKPPG